MKLWEHFGYTADDSDRLERIAGELVDRGAAADITIARRAIAAVTFQPALAAMKAQGVVDDAFGGGA